MRIHLPLSKSNCLYALIAVSIIALVFAISPLSVQAADQPLSDQGISDAVEDELLFDQAVPSNRIDVQVKEGVVRLTGTVNNILARERAARIAETVKGVRAVVNDIEVQPSLTRVDRLIRQDVEEALFANPATESYEIGIGVDEGVVTLSGTLESWREKQLAETIAKGVRGVVAVRNNIQVIFPETRADNEIQAEIGQALRWNILVDDGLIDVRVREGRVVLSGTVGSAAEKREAINSAWVSGVSEVDASDLEVARWARDPDLRKGKYAARSDEQIQEAVEAALRYDPRVNAFPVTVEVTGSVVTLRGMVSTLQAKRAAGQDARNTVGVTALENRLKVRPGADRSDAAIAADVHQALERDPYLERYGIDIEVVDGVVYLMGTVDSYFEKSQAQKVISGIKGVERIENDLLVEDIHQPLIYEPYVEDYSPYDYDWYGYQPGFTLRSDAEIRQEIRNQLEWSPFVDAEKVTVTVEDGMATLIGKVDSWSEAAAAIENAYEGGATWVRDRLEVRQDED